MQSKLSAKRHEFGKQIRKQQINTIFAEYRSKLVNSIQQQPEELQYLNTLLPHEPNRFSKIKIILQTMINSQRLADSQMRSTATGGPLTIIFNNKQTAKLQVKLNALQSFQIDNNTFVTFIKTLSKDICTNIQVVNINFQQSLKINTPQTLINKITIIQREVSQLIEIAEVCDYFLQVFVNLRDQNELIDQNLLIELTSCLIELSCFKPRHYSSNQQLEIVGQVNQKMAQFRQLINTSITTHLYQLVKNFTGIQLSINLIINIMYIFGNIFVSMSSNSNAHTQQYKELHDICFNLIRKGVLQINPTMQSEQVVEEQASHNQFSQFASVIVWFIRNQVLIIQGLFKTSKESNKENIEEPANQEWIILIVNIIEYFSNQVKSEKKLTEFDCSTLCDISSLLKLLKYDFQLPLVSLCDSFKYFQTFLSISKQKNAKMSKLRTQIYELAAQLLTYHPEEIMKLTQTNAKYLEIYNFVNQQALEVVKGEDENAQSFQLCSAILSNFCSYRAIKQPFYQQICSYFESLVNSMNKRVNILTYEQIKQRITFIFQVLKQTENRKDTAMQNELLSYDAISAILVLCSKIWESGKNKDEDVIETLKLLKLLAEHKQYSNLLKQVVTGEGYFQQLQNLQAETNAQINLLAYEIFQLLEIE